MLDSKQILAYVGQSADLVESSLDAVAAASGGTITVERFVTHIEVKEVDGSSHMLIIDNGNIKSTLSTDIA